MILEKIDDTRLLISLSTADMKMFGITVKQLEWKNSHSRQIIMQILKTSSNEIGFDIGNRQIIIESIPQNDGCYVIVTLMHQPILRSQKRRRFFRVKDNVKPIVFSFKDSEGLMSAVARICDLAGKFVASKVLLHEGEYYLIVHIDNFISAKLQSILSEYGNFIGKDSVVCARISEVGKVIAQDNAIEQIGQYFVG